MATNLDHPLSGKEINDYKEIQYEESLTIKPEDENRIISVVFVILLS
jgi:hypothetical protein